MDLREKDFNDIIETMIDMESLGEFLGRVAAIAHEKSDHISANYGDDRLSNDWLAASDHLLALAEECEL